MAGPTLVRPDYYPTGLAGYWKMDEAGGTRADSSGNGNTLTDNNTVGNLSSDYWNTGEQSANFVSSSSEYLSITDGSQTGLDIGATSFSIAFWIIRGTAWNNQGILHKRSTSGGVPGYQIALNSSGLMNFQGGDGAGNNWEAQGAVLTAGKWVHVACVYDIAAGTAVVYHNGVASPTTIVTGQTVGLAASGTSFDVGRGRITTNYVDMSMKDLAIWNGVALTPTQVKSLAFGVDMDTKAYRPSDVSVDPTAWWKLNEVDFNANRDRVDSIGSNDLTSNNTVRSGAGYTEGIGAGFVAANSEYLSVSDSADFDFSGGVWSFATWIKFDTTNVPIFSQATDANNYIRFTINSTKLTLFVVSASSTIVQVVGNTTIQTGVWYHVAVVEDGNDWKIYIDAQDDTASGGTDANRASNYTGDFRLGANQVASAFMDGLMSDSAIWKGYALTTDELKSLASAFPIQQQGVVSYWKLDEASGTRVDSIGANDLTDNNTVGQRTGLVDQAADFISGNSEYLSIADGSQAGLEPSKFSIISWANTDTASGQQAVVSKGNGSTSGSYFLYFDGSTNVVAIVDGTSVASSGLSAGVDEHLVLIADGANLELYRNSRLRSTFAKLNPTIGDSNAFNLGRRSNDGVSFLDGFQDEVLFLNRAVREEEVKTIYNKGLNGLEATSEPAPVADTGIETRGLLLAFPM